MPKWACGEKAVYINEERRITGMKNEGHWNEEQKIEELKRFGNVRLLQVVLKLIFGLFSCGM